MELDINNLEQHPLGKKVPYCAETVAGLVLKLLAGGKIEPVILLDCQVIDGWLRYRAWKEAVFEHGYRERLPWRPFSPKEDGPEPWDLVIRKLFRRNMKGDDYQEVVREHLRRHYQQTDAWVAADTHAPVALVKRERLVLEDTGEIPKTAERIDKNGRHIETARKPKPPPDAGDAWEASPEGSAEDQKDQEVSKAADAGRDMLGQELPPHLVDLFANPLYGEVASVCKKAARAIRGDGGSVFLLLRTLPEDAPVLTALERLAALMDLYEPHAMCPHCHGKEGGCPQCQTRGWWSRYEYEEAKEFERLSKKE